ncbi:hypothetical protein ABH966_004277 [Lysinibacillus sp. RC46]
MYSGLIVNTLKFKLAFFAKDNCKKKGLGDWSGGWATPWGSAIEERRLKPSPPVITPS